MGQKTVITLGMIIGSTAGGYLPTFFGISAISYTAVLTGGIGAIIGLWIGYKLSNF